MVIVQTPNGSVSGLEASEIKECLSRTGVELPEKVLASIAGITVDRLKPRLETNETEAIRFGALSYVVEIIRALPDRNQLSEASAVKVAAAFLALNPHGVGESLSKPDLEHFASMIQANAWDWEDLKTSFLDPEVARLDRLRRNLALSPKERLKRHESFVAQLSKVRRV